MKRFLLPIMLVLLLVACTSGKTELFPSQGYSADVAEVTVIRETRMFGFGFSMQVLLDGDVIARLKAEMAAVEAREKPLQQPAAARQPEAGSAKTGYITSLRVTYDKDRERRGSGEVPMWDGSGHQLLLWHYEKSLGRYFNNPHEIGPLVSAMGVAFYVVFFGIIVAMLVLLVGAALGRGPLYWLLAAVPALLPLFFIIDYSAWLWWYGHRLNDMGAFSVKPFMPTVFGNGKVAQFSTHSYPYWGFGLMLVLSVVIALMIILRRKQANRAATG